MNERESLAAELSTELATLRSTAKLRQRHIREKIGGSVSTALISQWENGKVIPSLANAELFAKICGAQLSESVREKYQKYVESTPTVGQLMPGERANTATWKEFIRAWQTSATIAEVAEKTKITVEQARAKRAYLASKGLKLKSMRRAPHLDWDSLKQLAAELMPPGEE